MKTVLLYAACWPGMAVIGILNGVLREKTYGKYMKELSAHQVSTIIALVLFGFYIWILAGAQPVESTGQALAVGIIWLVLTVAFEFVFGHYIAGHKWSRLLQDYNPLKGRIWLLVLIWITIAPYLFYRLRL